MAEPINVAVLGATGLVGTAMIQILQQRQFPVKQLYALASNNSAGKIVTFNNKRIAVEDVATFDFSKVQLALFSAGGDISAIYAPKAAQAGCIVIDNTSVFRQLADVPLVVPEVNPEVLAGYRNRNIIANPNCSTIQMVVALKPIYDAVGIEKIHVATYQSVSGSGNQGIAELATQTGELLNGRPASASFYPCQIAFNVIPQIDKLQDNGFTVEEMKIIAETKKIFADPNIEISATAVRVPVFFAHSEAVHIETSKPLTASAARDLFRTAPGVQLCAEELSVDVSYPTPAVDAVDTDPVYIGRIRNDIGNNRGLNLWIVADNIRKGAALNSVQIAELLLNKYLEL